MGNNDQQGPSAGNVLLAFLTGATMGAVAALLLAPRTGEETRDQLRKYARRAEGELHDLADRAGSAMEDVADQVAEKGRAFVETQKTAFSEALHAGREAMRRERERQEGQPGA
ncbi:MAG: YtxH domain-containing protein [Nitrospiraceae bacterium]